MVDPSPSRLAVALETVPRTFFLRGGLPQGPSRQLKLENCDEQFLLIGWPPFKLQKSLGHFPLASRFDFEVFARIIEYGAGEDDDFPIFFLPNTPQK